MTVLALLRIFWVFRMWGGTSLTILFQKRVRSVHRVFFLPRTWVKLLSVWGSNRYAGTIATDLEATILRQIPSAKTRSILCIWDFALVLSLMINNIIIIGALITAFNDGIWIPPSDISPELLLMVFFYACYDDVCFLILYLFFTYTCLRLTGIIALLALYEYSCLASILRLTLMSFDWCIGVGLLLPLLGFIDNIANIMLCILLLNKPFKVLWQWSFYSLSVAMGTTPDEWMRSLVLVLKLL